MLILYAVVIATLALQYGIWDRELAGEIKVQIPVQPLILRDDLGPVSLSQSNSESYYEDKVYGRNPVYATTNTVKKE